MVHTQRKSEGGFILFVAQDNCAVEMDSSPVICKIEYEEGYATFGMPEMYTMRMLSMEFKAIPLCWHLIPSPCYKRDVPG
jgi:hypothetical protein